MKKNFIFLFIFIFILNIFSQENLNNQKNALTGNIKKTPKSWVINLKYMDKDIKGEIKETSNIYTSQYEFSVTLNIFGIDYYGTINFKNIENRIYNISLSNKNVSITGNITTNYSTDSYRDDIFNIILGNKNFNGGIEYSRKEDSKNINLKLDDEIITGNETDKKIYNQDYSMTFNDKKITGFIKNKRPYYNFDFQSDPLNEDEVFLFLFVENYFLIDQYIMDRVEAEKYIEDQDKNLQMERDFKGGGDDNQQN